MTSSKVNVCSEPFQGVTINLARPAHTELLIQYKEDNFNIHVWSWRLNFIFFHEYALDDLLSTIFISEVQIEDPLPVEEHW